MVVAGNEDRLENLLALAEPLARRPARELIVACLLSHDGDLAAATLDLAERRRVLTERGASARVAAYTTSEPFAGVEHDWAAIEVAAWLAGALGTTLRLLGTEADPALGRRDASRLLARAPLLVQQVVGIVTEPLLVPPGDEGVLGAARDARMLVVGLSDRWRTEGIGRVRLAVAAGLDVPTLFVRRGLRPSGVAPSETLTRFTWTLASQHVETPG